MIELRDLAIGYRRRRTTTTVATGLRARARRGELTVLLGPNGCGKSTLIRTLCGLQAALDGQVLLDGVDLTQVPADALARRVAVVLTDRVDPGLLSARELAGLGRIPHLGISGRLTPDDDAVVDEALAAVNAAHLAARPAAELSDGERQRVLTARALAQQPSVLLLDEPTAFLDVPSRTGLLEMLRELARNHNLAVVLSTHDLELALRVADRVWLFDSAGELLDAIGEELVLSGRLGAVFDSDTLCFEPASGVFVVRTTGGRPARVDARDPLHGALQRILARQGWVVREPAEIVVAATRPDHVTVRAAGFTVSGELGNLPALLAKLPSTTHRCAPEAHATALLDELSRVSSYFTLTTGPVDQGWRPVGQLYTDTAVLRGIVDRLQARIDAAERRVAASTFFLGFAARLWSIGLGALATGRLLLDLTPEHLMFSETDGEIHLHVEHPVAWEGDALEPLLTDMVLATHLDPLAAALRRLTPTSAKLLRGNAASALLGAGGVLGGEATALARRLCADERLADAVVFTGATYRRTSCCLYYRASRGGLCGDCVLTRPPPERKTVPS
ncbi:ATP-binding cassette domain-containing protein [Mycobacterium shimoidei]|uniref:ABC transporter [Thermomonospora curvata DSM] n=1 Tax=Mycobacterium shimoidei TaxID=29313 RepID=A0A1E3TI10_MYCSH|nr:ATP-binding cassette domain-containing protein [Mycobacterium shimoidei]MCV7257981.1 (2Fe-2S)-binding protein [Mycobacterium shimoidei]ODR14084.1 ABC transporter [Mycobacterium shimoidei]ORW78861.1 ABC transporter [Mycobacterium shimoidei]SRX96408.1 ABC transporter [Thermomonospora curvata DSM] [Mycobacterium shimoidei]